VVVQKKYLLHAEEFYATGPVLLILLLRKKKMVGAQLLNVSTKGNHEILNG